MTVQTSVGRPAVIKPGQEYDTAFNKDVVSRICTGAIPFGARVYFNGDGTCAVPTATAHVTDFDGGIALKDDSKPSEEGYVAGDTVRVMRKGRCGVLQEEALAHGDTLFTRHVAAGAEQLGAVRNDADGTDGTADPKLAVFQGGSVANGAVVQVD